MKPPQSLTKYLDAARTDAPDEALVKMRTLKAFMAQLFTHIPTPGPGIGVRRSLNGGVWAAEGGGSGETPLRWTPTALTSTTLSVDVGTISDGLTTHTPDGSSVTVDASALNYVYLECDLTPDTVDGYVTGGTIDDVAIAAYTSTKTTTNSKGYVLLFTWQDGALVSRSASLSLQAELLNTGTGNVLFRTWPSS